MAKRRPCIAYLLHFPVAYGTNYITQMVVHFKLLITQAAGYHCSNRWCKRVNVYVGSLPIITAGTALITWA